MGKIFVLICKFCQEQRKWQSLPKHIIIIGGGGVTTNIKECIFDDAIKQYLIKKKYFETYGAYDCIEKVNAELCNFFISYVDYAIIKYPKEILKKELSCYISNPLFTAS